MILKRGQKQREFLTKIRTIDRTRQVIPQVANGVQIGNLNGRSMLLSSFVKGIAIMMSGHTTLSSMIRVFFSINSF